MADIVQASRQIDSHLRTEEGERLRPYLCDAGVPTIGVGATTYLDGRKVKLSDPAITVDQLNRMLAVEIDRYVTAVLQMVEGECNTNQLVALVICAYNIGIEAMRGSTMIRQHRAGNFEAAARAFTLWNKYRPKPRAALVEHPVLNARRLREAAIYVTPGPDSEVKRAPQAVSEESKLVASPIAQGGAITVGAGALTGVSVIADQLSASSGVLGTVKSLATGVTDTLQQVSTVIGIPPVGILAVALVVAGAVVIRNRKLQRREGWA